jgi:hypothetical protein
MLLNQEIDGANPLEQLPCARQRTREIHGT